MEPDPGALTRPGSPDDFDLAPDLRSDDGPSPFDLLARAASEVVHRDQLPVWPVPHRPGFGVRYTVEGLDPTRLQDVRRRATNRKTGVVHEDQVHCLVLAHQCVELYIGGQKVTADGRPLTFGSGAVREALGVDNAADAVRVFYGGPTRSYGFAILRHQAELIGIAGAATDDDEDLDEDDEDPTTATPG